MWSFVLLVRPSLFPCLLRHLCFLCFSQAESTTWLFTKWLNLYQISLISAMEKLDCRFSRWYSGEAYSHDVNFLIELTAANQFNFSAPCFFCMGSQVVPAETHYRLFVALCPYQSTPVSTVDILTIRLSSHQYLNEISLIGFCLLLLTGLLYFTQRDVASVWWFAFVLMRLIVGWFCYGILSD